MNKSTQDLERIIQAQREHIADLRSTIHYLLEQLKRKS